MKKATILAISLISISLLGAPLAQAASVNSDATVTLTDDGGGTEGENPTGPGGGDGEGENGGNGGELKPIEPGGNGDGEDGEDGGVINPNQKSSLRLSLLTAFNFGSIKMSGNTETYSANLPTPNFVEGGKQARPNFIQVTDNRGNLEGWKVTAKIATQFTYQDSVLTGSVITLKNAWAEAQSADNKDEFPIVPSEAVVLNEKSDVTIATAEELKGMGTWNILYGTLNAADKPTVGDAASSVTLTIPGNIQKKAGDYKAAIQWTLANTPNA